MGIIHDYITGVQLALNYSGALNCPRCPPEHFSKQQRFYAHTYTSLGARRWMQIACHCKMPGVFSFIRPRTSAVICAKKLIMHRLNCSLPTSPCAIVFEFLFFWLTCSAWVCTVIAITPTRVRKCWVYTQSTTCLLAAVSRYSSNLPEEQIRYF
jgi:hypothetical protein